MAVEVNLEKYGHRKKGFIGFSWTAFFFNFFVPIFRLDFIGFLIFVSPYLLIIIMLLFIFIIGSNDENIIIAFIVLFGIFKLITRLIFPFIYNSFYTKNLLKKGYLPPEDDDYSNAILKGNRYLEYTNEDLLDNEKIERYRLIIEEYERERKKDLYSIIMVFVLIGFLILFFIL
ncbi:HrgC protein [Fusobacterium sp. oral taxon C10]